MRPEMNQKPHQDADETVLKPTNEVGGCQPLGAVGEPHSPPRLSSPSKPM